MSFLGLRDLWASVGWIPLYAERTENSLTHQFKGSYLYAEVIGPSGLLRIDSIENERFNLELGMTVQAVGSFYPYHHHLPREIYIDISKNIYVCVHTRTIHIYIYIYVCVCVCEASD